MPRLTFDTAEVNKNYTSAVNNIATNCKYRVVKKNKTTCWVRLIEDNKETNTIYKGVRYYVLNN